MRVGFGYDIHPFREDESGQLRLGGIEIAGTPQLKGHSDGDSLIHAVIDALLGAAGEGELQGEPPPVTPYEAEGFRRVELPELRYVRNKARVAGRLCPVRLSGRGWPVAWGSPRASSGSACLTLRRESSSVKQP